MAMGTTTVTVTNRTRVQRMVNVLPRI
jgi:hypothetical protein